MKNDLTLLLLRNLRNLHNLRNLRNLRNLLAQQDQGKGLMAVHGCHRR
jgi:hypothetical protein